MCAHTSYHALIVRHAVPRCPPARAPARAAGTPDDDDDNNETNNDNNV